MKKWAVFVAGLMIATFMMGCSRTENTIKEKQNQKAERKSIEQKDREMKELEQEERFFNTRKNYR